MAALAQKGGLLLQQLVVVTAVGGVTGQAVFRNRGMLMQERPALFSVALVAELVDGIAFQTLAAE